MIGEVPVEVSTFSFNPERNTIFSRQSAALFHQRSSASTQRLKNLSLLVEFKTSQGGCQRDLVAIKGSYIGARAFTRHRHGQHIALACDRRENVSICNGFSEDRQIRNHAVMYLRPSF